MSGSDAFGGAYRVQDSEFKSYQLRIMREQLPDATIIVDAGVGTAATQRLRWNSALTQS